MSPKLGENMNPGFSFVLNIHLLALVKSFTVACLNLLLISTTSKDKSEQVPCASQFSLPSSPQSMKLHRSDINEKQLFVLI